MRPIERIDNFLEKVDWIRLKQRWSVSFPFELLNKEELSKIWKESPDQRFGQLAINIGMLPNGAYWSDEEAEILEAQGFPPEDYLFWTSMYDEHEKPLDEPITRLVADLDPKHIIRIKQYAYRMHKDLPKKYLEAFDNVLNKQKQTA